MNKIRRLVIVVPARNEERRIERCLQALTEARRQLSRFDADGPRTRLVVVADRCTDRTQQLAAGWPGVEVVRSDCGRVGGARAIGVDHALQGCDVPPAETWIACTDADSRVPPEWLRTQVRLADQGADLLLGTVRPDPSELGPEALLAWHQKHDLADGHRHVHGANLGIRAEKYLRAGGFSDVEEHEDVLLADRVRRLGGRAVSTALSPVLTSARRSGRTPAGMAGYLRLLLDEPA